MSYVSNSLSRGELSWRVANVLALNAPQHHSYDRLQHGPDQVSHGPTGVHAAAGELWVIPVSSPRPPPHQVCTWTLIIITSSSPLPFTSPPVLWVSTARDTVLLSRSDSSRLKLVRVNLPVCVCVCVVRGALYQIIYFHFFSNTM